MNLNFEWDDNKNAINIIKHGISFEDVTQVFFDPMRIDLFDWDHSYGEERWKVLGYAGWLLYMVNCTEKDNTIRIFSARKATKTEEDEYYYGFS